MALAPGDLAHGAARNELRRRPHIERIGALEREAARPCDIHRQRHRTRGRRRRAGSVMNWRCLARSVSLSDTLPDDAEVGPCAASVTDILAGLALDIVEIETERRLVAGIEEARQRRRHHHRIADDHVTHRLADAILAPGHAHDAGGAGKGRNVERRLRRCRRLSPRRCRNRARAASATGGEPSSAPPPSSPPVRIAPRVPCMPSISWP